MKTAQKESLTLTATAPATFPHDNHRKNQLRPKIMFIIKTRTPQVHKYDLRHSAEVKDDI